MSEDDWYEGSRSAHQKRSSGRFSFGQIIVIVIVVALISAAGGAFVTHSIISSHATEDDLQQSDNSVIIETPAPDLSAESEDSPADAVSASESPVYAGVTDGRADALTIQNFMTSVVGVYVEGVVYNWTGNAANQELGSGSGVIVSQDGYIVTNNHVISVDGADEILVHLQDGTQHQAKLIGSDAKTDLAVIKIDVNGLPHAVYGSSASTAVGETVYAVGNPLGVFASSVSSGIISGLDRTITVDGVDMTLMQTDAAVNPGNSGGGLFNANGELIGIVNAKSMGINVEGLGFAIPINTARPVITDIIEYGFVTGRPYIGITMQDVTLRGSGSGMFDSFGLFDQFFGSYIACAQIVSVDANSPAEAAGLREGDLVLALDDSEISSYSQFCAKLYEYMPGDSAIIRIQRGDSVYNVSVTFSELSPD